MERFCYQLGCNFWMQLFGQGLSLGTVVTQMLALTSACKPLGLGIRWRDLCEILVPAEHRPASCWEGREGGSCFHVKMTHGSTLWLSIPTISFTSFPPLPRYIPRQFLILESYYFYSFFFSLNMTVEFTQYKIYYLSLFLFSQLIN